MLDVIDFMERIGGDAQLSQASAEDFAASLSAVDMTPELQSAVIAGDVEQLGILLGTKPVCMLVAPPRPPGPPGPSPMRPAVPPPPGDGEEDEETKDVSRCEGVTESSMSRHELPRA